MSFGKRFGWLAVILLAGAGCVAQTGGPEGSVGEEQAALTVGAPIVPAKLDMPQTATPAVNLNHPALGATRAPVDPGATEASGDNNEPQPNPWLGGTSADGDGDDREPQPNPWLGRRGVEDGDGNEPQPNPWMMPAHKP